MGCQRDESVMPSSLLHRNWNLFRTREIASNDWRYWDSDAYYTVEYRADGTLVYRRNGVRSDANCCGALTYTFRGSTIQYTSWNFCPNAYCATIKKVTITQLSETLLEFNDGYMVYQYEPAK
ncbi:hypothetical protein GCM10028807_48770 [Spirosoma daeguense]